MQLRALLHRSTALSLRDQHADVTHHRVFTTRRQKPREHVDDPIEYLSDSDDERLPTLAERAGLEGELSDLMDPEDMAQTTRSAPPSPCSDWASEDEYPARTRVFSRPLSEVLRDADAWRTARETAPKGSPPPPAAPATKKKKPRRGGKAMKPRSAWTSAQRKAEKASISYAARTLLVREARRQERIQKRRESTPPLAGKFVSEAEHYSSSFKLVSLASKGSVFVCARRAPAGQSGNTSLVFRGGFCRLGLSLSSRANINYALRQASGPPPGCNDYVRKLVAENGFTYVPNGSFAQVFTDASGLIYAVKPAQPAGAQWQERMDYLFTKLRKLHAELKLSKPENVRHARGDFDRMSWGTAHGGGRKHPTTIYPDWQRNRDKLVEFFKDPIIQSICRHIQACVFTWMPDVARFYMDVQQELKDSGIDLQAVFGPGAEAFNLPFAAHTLNLGPQVRCILHRDSQNWTEGPCPVLVNGKFDHTRSGHFVLVEPKVILELCSGDVMILLSSLLTHGNAPLKPGELRMSWTCWMGGGLVRWLAAGCALGSSLTTRAGQAEYSQRAKGYAERGWRSLLTLSQLQARYAEKNESAARAS